MVGAYLQSVTMGQINVTFILRVYAVATFGSLQIDVRHLGFLANGFPEHLALIVAHVDAVNMVAGILANEIWILVNSWWRYLLALHHAGSTSAFLCFLLGLGTGVNHHSKAEKYCQEYSKSFHVSSV